MTELHQALATRVAAWRDDGYRSDRFPAIAEILGHAFEDDEARQLRYLVSLSLTGRPKRRKTGAPTGQSKGAWAR